MCAFWSDALRSVFIALKLYQLIPSDIKDDFKSSIIPRIFLTSNFQHQNIGAISQSI